MVTDRLGPQSQLGQADLVARAVVLKVGEVFAGRPQGDLESLHTGLQFRAARTQFQDAGFGLADLRTPERNALGEFGRLGFQGADPLPVGGDVALAGGNGLGKLADAGLHRGPLAGKRLLALALRGDAQSDLGKGIGGFGLGFAEQGDPDRGGGALITGGVEPSGGLSNPVFEARDPLPEGNKLVLKGRDLPGKGLAAMADVLQLARGQEMVGLRGGEKSLRVAEMLTGVPQPVDGGLEGGKRPFAGQ